MINLTEFSLSETVTDPDDLIESFIRSDYYWKDSQNDFVKANPNGNFLGSPFALDNIYAKDFRKLDKDQLREYIYAYRDNGTWNDTEESIKNLVSRFYEIYPYFTKQQFYLLNVDWFEPSTGRLGRHPNLDHRLAPEIWLLYDFFILLIWFDPVERTITVSEWYYD